MGESQNPDGRERKSSWKSWMFHGIAWPPIALTLSAIAFAFFQQETLPYCASLSTGSKSAHSDQFQIRLTDPSPSELSLSVGQPAYAPYIRFAKIVYVPTPNAEIMRPSVCRYFWDHLIDLDANVEVTVSLKADPNEQGHPMMKSTQGFVTVENGDAWKSSEIEKNSEWVLSEAFLNMLHQPGHYLEVRAREVNNRAIGMALTFLGKFANDEIKTFLAAAKDGVSSLANDATAVHEIQLRNFTPAKYNLDHLSWTVAKNQTVIGTVQLDYETRPSLLLDKADYLGHQRAASGDDFLLRVDKKRKSRTPFDWLNYKQVDRTTNDPRVFISGALPRKQHTDDKAGITRGEIDITRSLSAEELEELMDFTPDFRGKRERFPVNEDYKVNPSKVVADNCYNFATYNRNNGKLNEFDLWLATYAAFRHNHGFNASGTMLCADHRFAEILRFPKLIGEDDGNLDDAPVTVPDPKWAQRLSTLSKNTKNREPKKRYRKVEESLTNLTRDTVTIIFESPLEKETDLINEPAFRRLLINWMSKRSIKHFGCFHRHASPRKYSALMEVAWTPQEPKKSTVFWVDFKPDSTDKVFSIRHRPATLREVFIKVKDELPNGGVPSAEERMPKTFDVTDKCRERFMPDIRLSLLNEHAKSKDEPLVKIDQWFPLVPETKHSKHGSSKN